MKTTVTIDDDLRAQLARAARTVGVDVNRLVNDIVRHNLGSPRRTAGKLSNPFHQQTHDFGPPIHPSLDKAQQLADALEDEERLRKAGLLQ
ncbi:MAG: hypothetical protein FJ388_16100 [Verrucomicrobia bacterium]|nr:hypothetical protein [Verrucomicrobiota bacterium]